MNKPYVKQLDQRGPVSVWEVDGKHVRDNIDEEFTNTGHHWTNDYIPKNEIWIDKEAHPDEKKYFTDHQLVERNAMENGLSYNKANKKANAVEARERVRSGDVPIQGQGKSGILNQPNKKILKVTDDGTSVWLVNGRQVRNTYDLNFTEGGHDKVYKYVPKGEVWIDNDVAPAERPHIILHELTERNLMSNGMSYDEAHKQASHVEHQHRELPMNQTKSALKDLGYES